MPIKNTQLQRVSANLYRNPASGTYFAWFKRNGKQIKRSLHTDDRQLANQALRALLTESEGKDLRNLSTSVLFEAIAAEWLLQQYHLKPSSHNRSKFALNQLMPFFGKLEMRQITPSVCQKWAASRAKARKASTYNKELSILKGILSLAKERGFVLSNPAEGLKRGKVIDKERLIPTRAEFQTLLQTLRIFNQRYQEAANLIELLGTSGLRLGEACALKWEQVDFENDLVRVTGGETGTKSRKIRTIPLFPPMKAFLQRMKPEEARGEIIKVDSSKKALATACRHLGFPHYTHHSLRHFFCSNAIEAGVDFKTISEWLGHADGGILVAKTYGHLRQDHSQRMAKLLQ
jgi:integrase